MNVGIIGCGLIGQKRAAALGPDSKLLAVTDLVGERAQALASRYGAKVFADGAALLEERAIDTVIIATPHNQLAELTLRAVQSGKHVLLEKPGARRAAELEPARVAAERGGICVHVGFNHRFHPALRKARELIDQGKLGPLY